MSQLAIPVRVDLLKAKPVAEQPLEIVERKGIGHPDTICDAIAERVALDLVRAYRERFGKVQHFNVDKGLLVAGQVELRFGGGRVTAPMRLTLGDRATWAVNGARVPVTEIAADAARAWFREHLPRVDPDRDVVLHVELKPTSAELAGIFIHRRGPLPANDTSAAVGYAPLTPTERIVLETERFLNSPAFKTAYPETGRDIKVMGFRQDHRLQLTVAMPFLDAFITSAAEYVARKERVLDALRTHLAAFQPDPLDLQVELNTLDAPDKGMAGMYLSVTGTSAEQGDSGQVGRGNRVTGVISLQRPAPAEAAAGKNPFSHPGKVYTVLSQILAERIVQQVPAAREVDVWLGSQIGRPLDRPIVSTVQVALAPGVGLAEVTPRIQEIVASSLADLGRFVEALAAGTYQLF